MKAVMRTRCRRRASGGSRRSALLVAISNRQCLQPRIHARDERSETFRSLGDVDCGHEQLTLLP